MDCELALDHFMAARGRRVRPLALAARAELGGVQYGMVFDCCLAIDSEPASAVWAFFFVIFLICLLFDQSILIPENNRFL